MEAAWRPESRERQTGQEALSLGHRIAQRQSMLAVAFVSSGRLLLLSLFSAREITSCKNSVSIPLRQR